MGDSVSTADTDRFSVKVTSDSHFAWIRTRLSLERTMMSWLRTATALIGFGFAIVQFFERLQQAPEAHSAYLPDAPILLGLALIACGVLALVVAIWEYRWALGPPDAACQAAGDAPSKSVSGASCAVSTVIMRPHAEFGWAGLRHARYPSSAPHPSR